ncbi:hypothetical protein SFC43_34865 [Bacteroides sp. CR5/BHMF/2]|nr:hypothetical protein [Bacteroides sp. CR5/BHMF/2]
MKSVNKNLKRRSLIPSQNSIGFYIVPSVDIDESAQELLLENKQAW